MRALATEQAVVTLTVTRGNGTTYSTTVGDAEVPTDPLSQARGLTVSLVRMLPEVTDAMEANSSLESAK